ncbi:acetyltransferase [Hyphodiscus hymeniophilus]|uniref:Acetyltransferase n=1 Tax=Hyphodiscus hymeniophilus TaxID=353542 RepID=A0A9P7B0Y9_9HELO|nr:acetyltransferase [Hyphodiscus hymeniophilus]
MDARSRLYNVGVWDLRRSFLDTWEVRPILKLLFLLPGVAIYDSAPVIIGNRVLIACDVRICSDTHEVDAADRQDFKGRGSFAKPITIGDDCWIGMGVKILPGVTIGQGCTIAAGAVVAKDVEPNSLVGGTPAKLIRKLKGVGPSCILE